MFNRREMLRGMLQGMPLLAMAANVPDFLTRTAWAAADAPANKDKILVVLELTGGNDGLNMLVPYADPLYHKARPTIGVRKNEVIRIDDSLGLNPRLSQLETMLSQHHLSLVQGVGYPNPIRSHFESMDVWHTGDPTRRSRAGWLGQAINALPQAAGKIPGLNLNGNKLPLALQGGPAVPTINSNLNYGLELGGIDPEDIAKQKPAPDAKPDASASAPAPPLSTRQRLVRELTAATPTGPGSMAEFVRRTALDSYSAADRLNQILAKIAGKNAFGLDNLAGRLQTVAQLIDADFGARVFFLALEGFDTHSDQRQQQDTLFSELDGALSSFYATLATAGHADRVLLMTFSEFGRRVHENGGGTDHGSASTMILAGGQLTGGLVGKPPRLDDLADGDVKFQIDFRRVYATILDEWLKCDSRRVLGDTWEKLPLFKSA